MTQPTHESYTCDYCTKTVDGERVLVLVSDGAGGGKQVAAHPDCYEMKKAMR